MKRISRYARILLLVVTAAFLAGCFGSQQPAEQASSRPSLTGTTPPDAEKMVQQAEQARKSGNIPKAISLWEKVIQKYPGHAVAARGFSVVGNLYLAQGQPDRALQYFDYLVYTYPNWDGIGQARLDRLRALAAAGKKKQAMKEAVPLWETSTSQPDLQVGLASFMAGLYGAEGDIETGWDWAGSGFPAATTPEQKKTLTRATVDLLKNADEGQVKRLYKKTPSDFMKVFLDFRMAQLEMQKGRQDPARARLKELLARNGTHPLVPEIQAAIRGTRPDGAEYAVNADRIGVLIPLNGSFARYGDMVLKGLTLANSDWSERYPGQQVSLVVKDAQADAAVTTRSFEEMVKKDGVLAVIGPLGAQAAKEVAPLADRYGVPVLTMTQKDDEGAASSFVIHIFLDSREIARSAVKHCRDKLGHTRFAALYPDDRYGQKLAKIFSEVVPELGGQVVASVSYKEKTTDFKESLQKLITIAKKNQPPTGVETTPFDALFIPDQVQSVSLIAPQLPYNNVVGVTLLGTNLWSEAPLVQAGGVYIEHALFATAYYPENPSSRAKDFRERFQEKFGAPPSYLEAQAYDALMLVLQARSALRSTGIDRASLLQTIMAAKGFEGIAGKYSFSPMGSLERNYLLLQVQDGKLVQIAP